jgi:hypothetical protein
MAKRIEAGAGEFGQLGLRRHLDAGAFLFLEAAIVSLKEWVGVAVFTQVK